ncbi:hypothetical protein SAMN05216474_1534 [Lishizhenia tianjinensis]|uniref:Uncharacterized protein n=1 Tax=Lishizhenia tianjinensis TaxID=477690 RepID=A0A1I6ZPU9_9FLAO|nr:hypothetical protein [Lishizhenia tianjinensis]SFT64739.1 hypothetical protein SAMN05216474_1534 [Lishizhenia tianjinensis]
MKTYIYPLLFTALLFLSACGSKKNELPFSSKIEEGDVCALIHASELQEEILGSQLLNSLPSLRPFLLNIDLSQLLDFKNDSVFVVSDFKRVAAYVEINSSSRVQEQMNMWFKNVVSQQDSIANFAIYNWERENLSIAFNDSCIIFTHKYDINEKVRHFQKQTLRADAWNRILRSKKAEQNILVYLRDTLNPELSIFVYDTLINDELALHFTANSSKELPFLLKNLEQGYKKGDIGVNFHYEAKQANRVDHYLYKAMEKVGLHAEKMQNITTGDYRFLKGGETEIKKEIITTEMDENFNTVEVKQVITEKVKGFILELSGNEKAIQTYLEETGVLSKQAQSYQLMYESNLHLNSQEGLFCISSTKERADYSNTPPFMWFHTPLLNFTIPFIDYTSNQVAFTLFIDGKGELTPPSIAIF